MMDQAWYLSRLGKTWGDSPMSGDVEGEDYTLFYLVRERSGECWVVTREIEHLDGDVTYSMVSMADLCDGFVDFDQFIERGFEPITLLEYQKCPTKSV